MNSIGIVTDSHSGIDSSMASELGVLVLPMPFYINEKCYYEGSTLSREEFFQYLKSGAAVSTSQPSPAAVMEIWDRALEQYEKILYIPISSGLSGSYATAKGLAQEDKYNGRVFVINDGRVSTPLLQTVLDGLDLIAEGYPAEEIQRILDKYGPEMMIYVTVQDLNFLKRGGRLTPAAAALGNLMNLKPVLRMGVQQIDAVKKCHGMIKARHFMIEILKHDLETRFREPYEAGEIRLLAASSASPEETASWVDEIKAAFPGYDVLSGYLSLGTCCHIGPGGLGIGCSCKPKP